MIYSGFKKILVPLDLSESSLNALDTAISIAVRNDSSIALLFVKDPQYQNINSSKDQNLLNIEDSAEDILQALRINIQKKYSLDVVVFNMEGFVSAVINEMSIKWNAGLIVLGAHGASGYRQLFIGSNTYTVIKTAVCPVLAVPSLNRSLDFRKIILPFRLDSTTDRNYLFLKDIFSGNNAHLEIIGLSQKNSVKYPDISQDLVKNFELLQSSNRLRISYSLNCDSDVAESILHYIQLKKSDLLIITPSIDNSAEYFFVGPYAQQIISRSQIPILSVRKPSDKRFSLKEDYSFARI